MINRIIGAAFLIAAGSFYTIERVSSVGHELPNPFVVLLSLFGAVLILVEVLQRLMKEPEDLS